MTEKSQSEQNAAQRQRELLAEALEKARTEGGRLLNTNGKTAPRIGAVFLYLAKKDKNLTFVFFKRAGFCFCRPIFEPDFKPDGLWKTVGNTRSLSGIRPVAFCP